MSVSFFEQPRARAAFGPALMDELIADAADATGLTVREITGRSHRAQPSGAVSTMTA